MSTAFVVALGMGTVFTGLIVIIFLCKLMSLFVGIADKQEAESVSVTTAPAPIATNIPDKQPLLAAISAVVAEELGTDISNIRIHSIKRI